MMVAPGHFAEHLCNCYVGNRERQLACGGRRLGSLCEWRHASNATDSCCPRVRLRHAPQNESHWHHASMLARGLGCLQTYCGCQDTVFDCFSADCRPVRAAAMQAAASEPKHVRHHTAACGQGPYVRLQKDVQTVGIGQSWHYASVHGGHGAISSRKIAPRFLDAKSSIWQGILGLEFEGYRANQGVVWSLHSSRPEVLGEPEG